MRRLPLTTRRSRYTPTKTLRSPLNSSAKYDFASNALGSQEERSFEQFHETLVRRTSLSEFLAITLGVSAVDLRQPVDVRDVIARVVDGSRFEEFKPRYGNSIVCGWASVHGYPVGIIGNNGVIYPRSAEKATHFIQLCNQIDIPLVFMQNITGYMVGRDFEADGIIKKGSQMLNAVTNSTVPHITVTIGSSYGAGTYGMSGRAFGNRFTFLWPTAKIAVMGPKQIAGVMSMVRRGQAARQGLPFDEEEDRKIVEMVEDVQERGSLALAATGAISDDGIIDPRDTRTVLGMCLSVVRNRPIAGAEGYGVFRL